MDSLSAAIFYSFRPSRPLCGGDEKKVMSLLVALMRSARPPFSWSALKNATIC